MALIVTGVHRSGTSMVAGILSNLAIPMGEGAQMNPAPENPEGFFERIDVMQLNDSILKKLGGSWQAPPNLGPESWFSIDQNLFSHYRSSLDLFSGSFNSWFVKDPRISLILPMWDRLALTNLSLIFAVRNPQAVAQSLHLRNGLSHRRALALWWFYNQQLLSNVDSRDTLFIDYDSAKRSKKATTEKIAAFALKAVKVSSLNTLDSSVGNYDEDRILDSLKTKKAEQSINSSLSRSSYAKAIKGLAKSEIDETMDLYAALKNLHGSTNAKFKKIRTPDWVYVELQSARVEFQLTQTIEKLHDQVETTKIELATLSQLSQSNPETQEFELAQITLQTQSEELERLKGFVTALETERDVAHDRALLLHHESEREREELELAQSTLQTQNEELDRLTTHIVTVEAQRDSAQSQALLLHNESEREREALELAQSTLHLQSEELELAQSTLQTQSEELDRLKTLLIVLEARMNSAQRQALLLHNESEREREELELAQSEELDRLKTHIVTVEADRDSAQSQALLLHNESEREREALELAQSTLQIQSEELGRLKKLLPILEARMNSAQRQALLLHTESEREREELELAQSTLQTQSEELDRLQVFVTTLQEGKDSAQRQALIESGKIRKLTSALSAASVDLAENITELNKSFAELERVKKALAILQDDLNREHLHSQRLNKEFQYQIYEVMEVNGKNKLLSIELDLLKSSRGYRLISKYWKFKAKWRNAF